MILEFPFSSAQLVYMVCPRSNQPSKKIRIFDGG